VIEPVCDLSLGEGGGCCWKRFLLESVVETQRGRLAPMDCACDGVYSRAEQACGE
jgi:hypothetical protein